MTPLYQPKSRERGDFKEDEREKKPTEPQKQLSKERPGWPDEEPATEPGEQLRRKFKEDEREKEPSVKEGLPSQRNKEQPGCNK